MAGGEAELGAGRYQTRGQVLLTRWYFRRTPLASISRRRNSPALAFSRSHFVDTRFELELSRKTFWVIALPVAPCNQVSKLGGTLAHSFTFGRKASKPSRCGSTGQR